MFDTYAEISYYSVFGLLYSLIPLIIIVVISISNLSQDGVKREIDSQGFNISKIFNKFDSFIFYYDINGIITDVRSQMKNPK